MKCDIIMPVWDQLEFTRDCIESIKDSTLYPYRLILIDNGSKADTRNYLKSLEGCADIEVKLIRNEENLGFVKAVNQGFVVSDSPYLCVMNNDTLAADGWLTEMVNVAESDPTVGLVNPSSNNLGQKTPISDIAEYAEGLKKMKGEYIEMGACLGFAMLFKRAIFKKLGPFDEVYGVGNFEDTEYSRKVESLGMVCVRAKAAYVYHRMNKSFLRRKNYEEIFRSSQEVFHKRWGKPKRLLYIITKDHQKLSDWIKNETLKKARFGNWEWLFLKGSEPFEMREHSNVRIFYLPIFLFNENCIFRILKRKKKFDSIYIDEPKFLGKVSSLKNFHSADAMLIGG